MNQYTQVDVAAFKAQVSELLALYPELAEDDDLRADMVEGSTDLHRIATKLVQTKLDADSMASAIKQRKQDMTERQARYERKAEVCRKLLKGMMEAAGLPKVTLPEATITMTVPRVVVDVYDLDAVPQGYAKFEKRADKTALKAALMAGEDIPGAALTMSEDSGVTVRTK